MYTHFLLYSSSFLLTAKLSLFSALIGQFTTTTNVNAISLSNFILFLTFSAPLKVQITGFPVTATAAVAPTTTANVLRVDLGQRLMLNCSVLGGGNPPPKSIEWLHNGRVVVAPVLPSAGTTGSSAQTAPRIRLLSADVLHIARVVHGDSGSIFQCHVRNDFESAQAAVQLKLMMGRGGNQEDFGEQQKSKEEDEEEEEEEVNREVTAWQSRRLTGKDRHRSERDSGKENCYLKL